MKNLHQKLADASTATSRMDEVKLRLLENFLLDVPSARSSTWSYPDHLPSDRGDNIVDSLLTLAESRIAGLSSTGDFPDLLENVIQLVNPATSASPSYFCSSGGDQPLPTEKIWHVTAIVSIFQFSFAPQGLIGSEALLRRWLAGNSVAAPAALCLGAPGSLIWISDQSPLEMLSSEGVAPDSNEAAERLVQELALPGFELPEDRRRAIGILALEIPASQLENPDHAWKPTVFDALNEKGYNYLPGHAADSFGKTWPLQTDYQQHYKRDGLREYVTSAIEVPTSQVNAHLIGLFS